MLHTCQQPVRDTRAARRAQEHRDLCCGNRPPVKHFLPVTRRRVLVELVAFQQHWQRRPVMANADKEKPGRGATRALPL